MEIKKEVLKDSATTGLVSGTMLALLYKFALKDSNKVSIIMGIMGFAVSTTAIYYLNSEGENKNPETPKTP